MASRRQFLYVAGATLGLAPIVAWLGSPTMANSPSAETFPVQKTDAEWRKALTDEQYEVLREHSTERAASCRRGSSSLPSGIS